MSVWGTKLIERFEEYCPQYLAETGDPVGLHIGTLNKPIDRLMISLDVRPETVIEAIAKQTDLILVKHPPIFKSVERLRIEDPQEKMYADLLKHDIAVYAAHTNLDIIENGLNDWFCEGLAIKDPVFLKQTHEIALLKLGVSVPLAEAQIVKNALYEAGAGQFDGKYKNCSYSFMGTGHFTPINNALPFIGSKNQESQVAEERIEVVFPENLRERVVAALLQVHPYEEPAYDLISLKNNGKKFGLGRVGPLQQPMHLADFVQKVKSVFELDGLRVITKKPDLLVKRVAICGGSGQNFYLDALNKQADVYITGDVTYHVAHDMLARGLSVIDAGNYIESLCVPKLVGLFEQWRTAESWAIDIMPSAVNTDPFKFY